MPPRKSTASTTSALPTSPTGAGDISLLSAAPTTTEPKSPTTQKISKPTTGDGDVEKSEKKKSKQDDVGIDDLLLPRTLTSRLSRGTLPPNTSIQRDALLALAKSATVFISYLAHTANNLTSRKTIQPNDILEALRETELWNVAVPTANSGGGGRTLGERVQAEVEKWEDEVKGKRKGYRDRVKARESNVLPGEGEGDGDERGHTAKRVRRGSAADGEGERSMDVDEDAAAAQLLGEEAAANENENGDGTETDPEVGDGDEGEEVEDVDEEEQDEEEDDEQEGEEGDEEDDVQQRRRGGVDVDVDGDIDVEGENRQRIRNALAPNGRVEVGSDEESD